MPGSTRIIPLGGLGEVGKNMTVFEADGTTLVVDAGLAFPRDEHLGVDLILPDFSYLTEGGKTIRAVLLTHGHEDHVGALPYLLREGRVEEVWATRLTLGLIKSKLDEHGLLRSVERWRPCSSSFELTSPSVNRVAHTSRTRTSRSRYGSAPT